MPPSCLWAFLVPNIGASPPCLPLALFHSEFICERALPICRLQKAGAVLIAKLATGEMAFDDVWWGGKVKNPWNVNEGSSGSSAGPAAAVVAGAVAFAVRPFAVQHTASCSTQTLSADEKTRHA